MMFTLIKGGRIFAPSDLGRKDILLCQGRIALLKEEIEAPSGWEVTEVDASDMYITPGFVDLHVHVTGGGGEGGPSTRVPEIQLSSITSAGVTTIAGLLGTDDVTRHPRNLLAKVLGLRKEGISSYMMCGSYQFPPATITGSVRSDIALIPPVLGAGEVALSDHRSSQPSFREFVQLVAQARVGGMLGGKCGLVELHMGGGERGMEYIFRMTRETEIPLSQVLPTHVTRSEGLFNEALELAGMGGNIDVTASGSRSKSGPSCGDAVRMFKSRGIPLHRMTVSSDANGSIPRFDSGGSYKGTGIADIKDLNVEFRQLLVEEAFPPEEIVPLFTMYPAVRLGLQDRKGSLEPGWDADLVIFDRDWNIRDVYAMGRLMLSGAVSVETGTFE